MSGWLIEFESVCFTTAVKRYCMSTTRSLNETYGESLRVLWMVMVPPVEVFARDGDAIRTVVELRNKGAYAMYRP